MVETGNAGTSPKQKVSPHQEWCSAVQEVHLSHDGLRVPRLVVQRSLAYQETGGASAKILRIATNHLGTLVTGKYTIVLESLTLPTASDLCLIRPKAN